MQAQSHTSPMCRSMCLPDTWPHLHARNLFRSESPGEPKTSSMFAGLQHCSHRDGWVNIIRCPALHSQAKSHASPMCRSMCLPDTWSHSCMHACMHDYNFELLQVTSLPAHSSKPQQL